MKLPGEGVQFKLLVLSEYLELFKFLKTEFIVGSLEISIEDVVDPPRPFLSKLVSPLDPKQKLFHLLLESPKR